MPSSFKALMALTTENMKKKRMDGRASDTSKQMDAAQDAQIGRSLYNDDREHDDLENFDKQQKRKKACTCDHVHDCDNIMMTTWTHRPTGSGIVRSDQKTDIHADQVSLWSRTRW